MLSVNVSRLPKIIISVCMKMERFYSLFVCIFMITTSAYCQTVETVVIVPEKTYLLILEGDQLKLDCVVTFSGKPNVQATFSKDGQVLPVDNNKGYDIIVTEKPIENDKLRSTTTLTKNVTDENDKGVYSCEVTGKPPVQITVYTFTATAGNADMPVPVEVKEGKDSGPVELQCNIDVKAGKGVVKYNVSWEHEGREIVEDERFSINANNNTLQISNPKRSDMGEYQCVITFFPDSSVEKHIIRLKPYLLSAVETVVTVPEKTYLLILEGDQLKLDCVVTFSGKPNLQTTFSKDGQVLPVDNNKGYDIIVTEKPIENDKLISTTTLTKYVTDENDKGVYSCEVTGKSPAHITVYTFTATAGNADMPVPVEVKEGKDSGPVELQCNIDVKAGKGVVKYNVSWEHEGREIVEDERFSINANNNTLQISNPKISDMGEYQCVITFFPDSSVEKHIIRLKPYLLREREVSGSMSAHGRPLQSLFLVSLSVRYLTYIFVPNLN